MPYLFANFFTHSHAQAAKFRKFEVIVAESAPTYSGNGESAKPRKGDRGRRRKNYQCTVFSVPAVPPVYTVALLIHVCTGYL